MGGVLSNITFKFTEIDVMRSGRELPKLQIPFIGAWSQP